MNLSEFLDAFEEVASKHKCYFSNGAEIRCDIDNHFCCPITAVHYDRHKDYVDIGQYDYAAGALGLENFIEEDIVAAADNNFEFSERDDIREELLRRAGLEEWSE